jgi:hypothetical protein
VRGIVAALSTVAVLLFTASRGSLTYYEAVHRPKDLGYWIGYKITGAYYNKASDGAQAIEDILTITDFDRFLEQSGLAGNP